MINIDKFYADVQRIKKYDRAQNAQYDGFRVCQKVAQLFEDCNRDLGELPHSISEYWLTNYVGKSADISNEPSEKNLEWLLTVLSFFDGNLDKNQDLPRKDWKAILEFINYEAEELPINTLTDLMKILVEKNIL